MTTTTTTGARAAVALLTAWERADGRNARRPSVSLQLAVVQYCADMPGTPVPALDDLEAVRALVGSLRRYRVRYSNDARAYGVWDVVRERFAMTGAPGKVVPVLRLARLWNEANV
jgi:hypothetical protein